MDGVSDLRAALRALLRERREAMEPPSPEELIAYREGTLSADAAAEMEARLAAFPEAAEVLRDLNRLAELEAPPGTPPLSEADLTARWEDLLARVDEEEREEERPADVRPLEPLDDGAAEERRETSRSRWLPMAAVLVAGVVLGWAGSVLLQPATAPPAATPEAGGASLALAPVGERTARTMDEDVAEVAAGEPLFLVLELPAAPAAPAYRVSVQGPGDRRWQADVAPSPFGELNLHLPGDWLVLGNYGVSVRSAAGAEVARYRFEAR